MGIILVGASPKARLVLDFLASEGRSHEVKGIVDRDAGKHGTVFSEKPVWGDLETVLNDKRFSEESYCICLSENNFSERIRLQEYLEDSGRQTCSIVSKTAFVARSAHIKPGSIVFPGVIINSFAKIGRCVTLYTAVLIEHDCVIEDNVEISSRASLGGRVTVGSDTFIGMNASILPNLTIGSKVIIGAGAVITKPVPDHMVLVGNPGRVLKKRDTWKKS